MKNYSFDEAIDFFRNLPHFAPPVNGTGKASDYLSLDAELALLDKLNNPQKDLKYIHVAGTNGKGSTSAFIASILKEANFKVGLFTSPFLFAYNEMFKVNSFNIPDNDFAEIFSIVKPKYDEIAADGIFPSEYEILTVMALIYFKNQGCDIVVLEVSMGGRVDTTNVIPSPLVTVITPISYDHMGMLGNTLSEIAMEKAGIIKENTKVVSAAQEQEVKAVLASACGQLKVELEYLKQPTFIERNLNGQTFKVEGFQKSFHTRLLGTYQINNASLAVQAVAKLRDIGFQIPEEAFYAGVEKANWFGRFTLIKDNPPVIVDGGHNRQGAEVLAKSLKAYFPNTKITFILGILKDKEIDVMLDSILPLAKEVYTVQVPNARTMDPEDLARLIQARGVKAQPLTGDINDLSSIESKAEVICIAGSLYLLGSLKLTD